MNCTNRLNKKTDNTENKKEDIITVGKMQSKKLIS